MASEAARRAHNQNSISNQGGSSGFKERHSFEMPDCQNAEEKSGGKFEFLNTTVARFMFMIARM